MFRFGPSGIPLSCKGRTQRDGIEDVHTLGLNAMEIQFVRVNVIERYASDDEIGMKPRDIEGELVVEVMREEHSRETGEKVYVPKPDLEGDIKKGDKLRCLISGIGRDYHELRELGEIAKDLDLRLSVHTPYYMDLIGEDYISEKGMENIKWGALIANELGADMLVTHLGLYGNHTTEQSIKLMTERIKAIRDWVSKHKLGVQLGLETSGRQMVFGSLDEILAICKKVSGVVPVLNFAHIHAREGGSLKRKEDFQDIFDRVRKVIKTTNFYAHFSGVEHEGGNEKRYTPIKKGDMKFEPLAECLLDNDYEVTVISGSPLLEHDAMYMKLILERVQLKREMKAAKAKEPSKGVVPKRKKRTAEEIELEPEAVGDEVGEASSYDDDGGGKVEGEAHKKVKPATKDKGKEKIKKKEDKPKPTKKQQAQRVIVAGTSSKPTKAAPRLEKAGKKPKKSPKPSKGKKVVKVVSKALSKKGEKAAPKKLDARKKKGKESKPKPKPKPKKKPQAKPPSKKPNKKMQKHSTIKKAAPKKSHKKVPARPKKPAKSTPAKAHAKAKGAKKAHAKAKQKTNAKPKPAAAKKPAQKPNKGAKAKPPVKQPSKKPIKKH